MIQITVYNDDADDDFVQVVDNNQQGAPQVFNGRVNSKTSSPNITVQEDGTGHANITWTATDTNDATKTKTATPPFQPSAGDQVDVSNH